jgi:hypothetical protein
LSVSTRRELNSRFDFAILIYQVAAGYFYKDIGFIKASFGGKILVLSLLLGS